MAIKPHIFMHNGYWRCSLITSRKALPLYIAANSFTNYLNNKRRSHEMKLEELSQSLATSKVSLAGKLLTDACHGASTKAGWWNDLHTGEPLELTQERVGDKLMLIVTEIAEAKEGHRKNKMDDHLPKRMMVEVELADAVIRIFDLAGAMRLDLGNAIAEKMRYNMTRADHKPENRKAPGGKVT